VRREGLRPRRWCSFPRIMGDSHYSFDAAERRRSPQRPPSAANGRATSTRPTATIAPTSAGRSAFPSAASNKTKEHPHTPAKTESLRRALWENRPTRAPPSQQLTANVPKRSRATTTKTPVSRLAIGVRMSVFPIDVTTIANGTHVPTTTTPPSIDQSHAAGGPSSADGTAPMTGRCRFGSRLSMTADCSASLGPVREGSEWRRVPTMRPRVYGCTMRAVGLLPIGDPHDQR